MKLLLDEHYPRAVAEQLRALGHDVVGVPEVAGLRGAPDPQVLERARADRRVLVTENVADFARLDGQSRQRNERHQGLVFTTNKRFPRGHPDTIGRLAVALHHLLTDDPDLRGRCHWLRQATSR